jgi:hypothetical protein
VWGGVGWLVSQIQGLHINMAGCKELEGSKCQMLSVKIFKARNRTTEFLEFQPWGFIV